MSTKTKTFIIWFYMIATVANFLAIASLGIFEGIVRWSFNQNFAFLDGNGFAALAILLAAQMLGLVWLSRTH